MRDRIAEKEEIIINREMQIDEMKWYLKERGITDDYLRWKKG